MTLANLQKPKPHVLNKLAAKRDATRAYREACAVVRQRDGGKCRACAKPGNQAHHIVYRSRGGKNVPSNLIWACDRCHKFIHAKVTLVSFDPKRPAASIKFTRNTQWDSHT